jgi:hypothetical protein
MRFTHSLGAKNFKNGIITPTHKNIGITLTSAAATIVSKANTLGQVFGTAQPNPTPQWKPQRLEGGESTRQHGERTVVWKALSQGREN